MVTKEARSSISEDGDESNIINENGKRPSEDVKDVKKRIKTKSLYRQPTVNELNRLQETESLFNSNLFRLQIEEILQEVKVKEKTVKQFQEWFASFRNHLLAIPNDDKEYDLTEKTLSRFLKVKIPLSSRFSKTKVIFKFHKFSAVEVVGSYFLETAINSKLIVDVQITVPADTYTKNDSINYRYHKKRAAYLAYVASHINKYGEAEDLKYVTLHGCEAKPLLDVKPKGKLGTRLTLRINLVCEEEAYKLHRFSPVRNNLREAWVLSEETQESNKVGPPTPYYNNSVLCDLTASINHQFLKEIFENSENLRQAVVLLKIWLRQRKLQVSGYIVSLYVAHLVQAKRINNIMSSYQIIRNVWIALKSSEWDTTGISLHKGPDTPPLEVFIQHFPVVFLDCTGYYNMCWQMCRGTYCALKRECELAVDMLDNGKINSFIPLFMVPVQPLTQFNHILLFKDMANIIESVLEKTPKQDRVNYGVDSLAMVTDVIYSLLRRGLGDRVSLILQIVDADFSWPVKKTLDKAKDDSYKPKLSFGFILNPENAMNIVDKGPSANLPEAEEFRAFWGDKSELRRFQDGSITETCVWSGESTAERRTIAKQIVDYLFQFKYGVPASQLFHICDQLDSLTARKGYSGLQGEASALQVLQAFDDLRRDMRALTEMPLDVSAVYGVSPVFSYCEPFPAVGSEAQVKPWRRGNASLIKEGQVPEYTPVNHVVVELGHSGKWPGDVEAFRCLKAAFLVQLGERLGAQFSLPAHAHPAHLDVLKAGKVFRLFISHPKEITLLRRETENGVVKYHESEESVRLQCDSVLMPRLRGALHGLQQKHPAFGPTACLFKRWLCCHLLSPPHFPAAVAELLVAATFVHCAPLTPCTQPTAGLVRVLRRLVDTDWGREMLVLDFNEDMTREEITDLERKFNERESATPHMYIVTAYDGDLPSVWSHCAPSGHVLRRAQALARATLSYIEKALLEDFKDNILGAFVPSLSGYDVLIYLHCSHVPYATERVDSPPRLRAPPETPASDVIPVVEFNVVDKYLEELRAGYSEFAVFFHDAYGGDVIAVLWKPEIHGDRELQIGTANALKPVIVDGETKYRVNIEALVEDFRLLGEGLVRDIVLYT